MDHNEAAAVVRRLGNYSEPHYRPVQSVGDAGIAVTCWLISFGRRRRVRAAATPPIVMGDAVVQAE